MGAGEDSNDNGHKWGQHGVSTGNGDGASSITGRGNANHGFGNERGIDTYTFVLGDESTKEGAIRSLVIDLAVNSVTNDFAAGPDVEPGDTWTYTSYITNKGPNHALAQFDGPDLIESTGSFFEFFLPQGVDLTDLDDIVLTVIADPNAGAKEVLQFPRELVSGIGGGNKVRIMVDLPVDAIIKVDIPVMVGSNATPGTDLVAWGAMVRPHDVTDVDATNTATLSPANPFLECVGAVDDPGYPSVFNPLTWNGVDPIPCNNVMPNIGLTVLRTPA